MSFLQASVASKRCKLITLLCLGATWSVFCFPSPCSQFEVATSKLVRAFLDVQSHVSALDCCGQLLLWLGSDALRRRRRF